MMINALMAGRISAGGDPGRTSLADEESGVAALEFALVLPLLTTLLLGAADVAITAARARQVEAIAASAVHAVRATAEPLLAGLATALPAPVGTGPRGQNGRPTPAPPAVEVPLSGLVSLPDSTTGSVRLFLGCADAGGIAPAAQTVCPDGAPAVPLRAPSGRLVPWPGNLLPADVEARTLIRLD